MSLTLTDEQRAQMEAEEDRPTEVIDPRTGERYRLVPQAKYDIYEDLLDRVEQEGWVQNSMRTLARWYAEEDRLEREEQQP